jgi:hypothetical protein
MRYFLAFLLLSLPAFAENKISIDARVASKAVREYRERLRLVIPERLYSRAEEAIRVSSESGNVTISMQLDPEELPYVPQLIEELEGKGFRASNKRHRDILVVNW